MLGGATLVTGTLYRYPIVQVASSVLGYWYILTTCGFESPSNSEHCVSVFPGSSSEWILFLKSNKIILRKVNYVDFP